MIKIMIAFFTFVTVFAAQAAVNGPMDMELRDGEVNENKTYFEVLGDLYKEGTKPSVDTIINIAWAGRCFLNTEPSNPLNGGYIFRKMRTTDVGPIGREVATYEAASYWAKTKSPGYYDNMNVSQVLAAQPEIKFSRVVAKAQELEINQYGTDISAIRISGKYLVEEIYSVERRTDVGPIGGPVKKIVGIRCYYFIPELN